MHATCGRRKRELGERLHGAGHSRSSSTFPGVSKAETRRKGAHSNRAANACNGEPDAGSYVQSSSRPARTPPAGQPTNQTLEIERDSDANPPLLPHFQYSLPLPRPDSSQRGRRNSSPASWWWWWRLAERRSEAETMHKIGFKKSTEYYNSIIVFR